MSDSRSGPSRITHSALVVLACLHETDATCREVWLQTTLSESSAYRWVTKLAERDILETYVREKESGNDVVVYHLDDEELGAAASVILDRLVGEEAEGTTG